MKIALQNRMWSHLRDLTRDPLGSRAPTWLICGCICATALILFASLDAAAGGRNQADDFISTRSNLGLVASDDFDGPAGSPPSQAMWTVRHGGGGWGNEEKQQYTNSRSNVSLDGSGNLRITAHRDGKGITSARLDTLGKLDISTGLVAVRARLPEGQGLHPAIWMLGSSMNVVGYPESGEIDIFEQVNSIDSASMGALGPRVDLAKKAPWKHSQTVGPQYIASSEFHIYWVHRTKGLIEWGVDGHKLMSLTPKSLPAKSVWVMDEPFYVILNLAVGGQWPGPVTTPSLPAVMTVDWVRVYS